LRSVLCVPLISRQVLLGVIYLENRRAVNAFAEADIPGLMIFASQAAVAIHNAQLNHALQTFADDLERRVEARTAELDHALQIAEDNWQAMIEENRQRTALLANIAHDLRSPLNTVVSSLMLMQEGAFGELTNDQSLWIERSLAAVQQVLRLATDVFDLTKLEQGRLTFDPHDIDLMPILEEALSIAEGMKKVKSKVELILDVPEELPLVHADADRVRQILTNLLSNALKFTPEGGVAIRAWANDEGDKVNVFVEDTGIGIPEDDLPFIFDRYRQAANQERSGYKGTGLGLAICKQLVEQHEGTLTVQSQVDVGTTFSFSLPVAGL
jgi:two-component system sensor histidine kinase/response regulator